jgi:hypothetical protein
MTKINTRRWQLADLARALRASVPAAIVANSGFAQTLPDPTRPPASVTRNVHADGSPRATSAAPIVQSIFIARDQRSAVISGETVTVGGQYGDARVVRITESEVVLKGSEGVATLQLYPLVDKRAAPAPRRDQA